MDKHEKELCEVCIYIFEICNLKRVIKEKRSSNVTRPISVQTYLVINLNRRMPNGMYSDVRGR